MPLGAGGVLLLTWLRRLWRQQWAPLRAEAVMLRTLWRDGVCRVFAPIADDGTSAQTLRERWRRVQELRAVLGLERMHQIDVARRRRLGQDGWGETSGTLHMQHLPGLVFRGADEEVARRTLARHASLAAAKAEAVRLHQECEQTPVVKDLVLVGGGHSHVHLLRMLGMEPLPGVRVTLVTRDVETPYSGMLPGHVAGLYTRRECHLDLNVLARYARVRLVYAPAVGLDVAAKQVLLDGRPPISYDVLSINIGSAPRVVKDPPPGAPMQPGLQEAWGQAGITPVKPIDGFGARWDDLLTRVPLWKEQRRVVVVGGGAGGFELAMGMHARLHKEIAKAGTTTRLTVTLVTRSRLLPQHNPGVRSLAQKAMRERGVELLEGYDVSHVESGLIRCRDGRSIPYDDCIWCTQGRPQSWVSSCGLATDKNGFLLVDQQMRCRGINGVDVGPIFAGGDIATIDGHERPKAGVFAVMAGMALWINISATLRGEDLVTYWPQGSFLGLLNLGDGSCIASRGALAMEGAWLWELKDWIDRRWMWNYSLDCGLPEMPLPALHTAAGQAVASAAGSLALLQHTTMRCGGCGAKVGATTLGRAMARVDIPLQPRDGFGARVVLGAGDDAAVVELATDHGDQVATVQTIDFFRSFIGDPYVFGRIAAVHALSDCEAMGAVPQTALALAQLPYALEERTEEELVQLMSGAAAALREAGCALVGGHTCEARELGLGLAVCGRLPQGSSSALQKGGMMAGNRLVLTKPIGTGTLFAADMRAKARGPWIQNALRCMAASNAKAAAILREHGAIACTDVTGFGLVGHLLEMCKASQVQVAVDLDSVPLLEGSLDCLARGITSSLQPANTRLRRAVANHDAVCRSPAYPMLFDPQTAGGLLAAVPGIRAEACVKALRDRGGSPGAAVIGEVLGPLKPNAVANGDGAICVRVVSQCW